MYLDAVWTLNIFMDGMILYLTQGLTRAKTTNKRLAVAALFASCIVPITVYMPHIWLTSALGKLFFSLFIIYMAFSFKSIQSFFIQWLTFYFVTFAIGGALLGIHFFLNSRIEFDGSNIITFSSGYGDPVSWVLVCVGFPLSWLFTKWRMEQVQAHKMKSEDLYTVTVSFDGKQADCTGLVDSGNQLIDPISKKMVFLADLHVWKQLLPEQDLEYVKTDEVLEHLEELSPAVQSAVRVVPYQGAGSLGQLMVTFFVESITIHTDEGQLKVDQPLLGVQHHDLTHDQMYQILIHPHASLKGITA
ncbi:sigma-E processing peptidase SpoIIGA [Halobacillus hunanensis]|uniref:sigma-E processing peptidase SpoIIGA n=1 Tax=Halobacillus hunanensis TaxID=578214 RepID=UPI002481C524|nr:sigma-E processing peptidase SpoIIGA [Halobacillus hunanensis]